MLINLITYKIIKFLKLNTDEIIIRQKKTL